MKVDKDIIENFFRIFSMRYDGNLAKTQFGNVLEYFCEIGMNLRLRQNLELSENIFAKMKLDLENFCPKRREKRNLDLESFCSKRQKGEKELVLE